MTPPWPLLEGPPNRDTADELDIVAQALYEAQQHGLQAEVMLFALYAMQGQELTVEEAVQVGMREWDI